MRQKYHVVSFSIDDNGEPVKRDKQHFVYDQGQGQQKLCTGEFFGVGESGAVYSDKIGYITCPDCIRIIMHFKKINP